MITLAALYHYPLKSGRARALTRAAISPAGLEHDRHWMVADADGRFITGRECPQLVLVDATPAADGIRFAAPGMPPLQVSRQGMTVAQGSEVWGTTFTAWQGAAHANAWFSEYLQRDVRLLWIGAAPARRVRHEAGIPLGFADGYPLLIISQAALKTLNADIGRPLPMLRFRPNLVLAGCEPHAEDHWQRIRIGTLEIELVKLCTRCVFTTIDPDTALKDPEQQPLRTLAKTRRQDKDVIFGMNALTRSSGELQIGMPVEILA
ncbi:MOSC domain-containing protein [Chitinilyticum litopenaei]|uniref:MOSC domain-containing protein n=1 Tax=Chitinilyticum litopenaei TaxID=1121276 RepID=UPI0004207642|nr:MOSC domain-containing protein [Chitinilyticum litopenaei]